jgi:hypothetical protein
MRELSHAESGIAWRTLSVHGPPHPHRTSWREVSGLVIELQAKSKADLVRARAADIGSLLNADAFHDRDVSINGNICERFHAAAGLRPSDVKPIDLRALADAQHFTRIVG